MKKAWVVWMTEVIAEVDSVRAAEQIIELIEVHDPMSVHAGDYGIDATEEADAEYQMGMKG